LNETLWGGHVEALCADNNFIGVCNALTTLFRCSVGDLCLEDRDIAEMIIAGMREPSPAAEDTSSVPPDPVSIGSAEEEEAMAEFELNWFMADAGDLKSSTVI
jgi:hypothetical protein